MHYESPHFVYKKSEFFFFLFVRTNLHPLGKQIVSLSLRVHALLVSQCAFFFFLTLNHELICSRSCGLKTAGPKG